MNPGNKKAGPRGNRVPRVPDRIIRDSEIQYRIIPKSILYMSWPRYCKHSVYRYMRLDALLGFLHAQRHFFSAQCLFLDCRQTVLVVVYRLMGTDVVSIFHIQSLGVTHKTNSPDYLSHMIFYNICFSYPKNYYYVIHKGYSYS